MQARIYSTYERARQAFLAFPAKRKVHSRMLADDTLFLHVDPPGTADYRRLRGVELTDLWIDEAAEISPDLMEQLRSRVR